MMGAERAEYDIISRLYMKSKELPFRKHIEQHTIFALLGNLHNKTVLDLGCGEGIYARLMKRSGAQEVVGLDLSQKMIDLAIDQERTEALGIRYICGDASSLAVLGSFDLVLGSYLLNYAQTRAQLKSMVQGIFRNLKAGGRFVGFNNNPSNSPADFRLYRKYGFIKTGRDPLHEGDTITYCLFNPDGTSFSVDNFFLTKETHEEVFRDVGFSSFAWRPAQLSRAGKELMDAEEKGYWDVFLAKPPFIALEAQRPNGSGVVRDRGIFS